MSLDEMKSKLSEFINQNSISKFDADDIVELITEGEDINWIVDQMKGDKEIDADAVKPLLIEIKKQVNPEKEETADPATEAVNESVIPDLSQADLSSLDLSEIDGMLPEGMALPPGLNAGELKKLIESPQGKIMADFIAFCQEKGIALSNKGLNDPRIERQQKEWLATPRDAFEGKTPADMLSEAQVKVETFRREEPRIGRNDPCPCGSGKKYKKCCGKS